MFLLKLERCLRTHLDPGEVDRTGDIPKSALKALAEIGCFGMKIPKRIRWTWIFSNQL